MEPGVGTVDSFLQVLGFVWIRQAADELLQVKFAFNRGAGLLNRQDKLVFKMI